MFILRATKRNNKLHLPTNLQGPAHAQMSRDKEATPLLEESNTNGTRISSLLIERDEIFLETVDRINMIVSLPFRIETADMKANASAVILKVYRLKYKESTFTQTVNSID